MQSNDKTPDNENDQSVLEPDAEYISRPPFDDDQHYGQWKDNGFVSDDTVVKDDGNEQSEKTGDGTDDQAKTADDTQDSHNDNPPTEAAGISYNEDQGAPVLSEIGSGERADAIIAMAKEFGVYIHRDERLLSELKRLREGEEIPKELYALIAAILSFSYLLQGKTPSAYKRADGSTAINTKA